jgi:hypothetical protein
LSLYPSTGAQKHLLEDEILPFFLRSSMIFETSLLFMPVIFARSPGLIGFPAFFIVSGTMCSLSAIFSLPKRLEQNIS